MIAERTIADERSKLEAGSEIPNLSERQGKDGETYVEARNANRRHMTPTQIAASIVTLTEFRGHGGDRKSEDFKGSREPLPSQQDKADSITALNDFRGRGGDRKSEVGRFQRLPGAFEKQTASGGRCRGER